MEIIQADCEIKLASADDAQAIAAVLLDAFLDYRPLYTEKGFLATTPDATKVSERMQEGPIWVARVAGIPTGTASAVLKTDSLYVRGMAVLPQARGRNIGRTLLEVIQAYAVANDCERMFLSTTPFLNRAIRLYESFGFTTTEAGPHDLFGTPLLTMEKYLK